MFFLNLYQVLKSLRTTINALLKWIFFSCLCSFQFCVQLALLWTVLVENRERKEMTGDIPPHSPGFCGSNINSTLYVFGGCDPGGYSNQVRCCTKSNPLVSWPHLSYRNFKNATGHLCYWQSEPQTISAALTTAVLQLWVLEELSAHTVSLQKKVKIKKAKVGGSLHNLNRVDIMMQLKKMVWFSFEIKWLFIFFTQPWRLHVDLHKNCAESNFLFLLHAFKIHHLTKDEPYLISFKTFWLTVKAQLQPTFDLF